MNTTVLIVLTALSGLIIGTLLTILYRMLMNHRRNGLALDKASEILKSAEEEKRLMVLAAQEEVISIRSEMENELKSRRLDLQRSEQRLSNKEDNVDRRSSNLDRKDKEISRRAEEISSVEEKIKDIEQKALNDLEKLSKKYRLDLFEKFLLMKQGHVGSIFSIMDIVVALYHCGFVRYDQNKKNFLDKVLISKGHATASIYPILKDFGVISKDDWDNWGHKNSLLRVFGNIKIPGIEVT